MTYLSNHRGDRSVIVTVMGNGHDMSSIAFHIGEGMNPIILPPPKSN